MQNGVAGRDNSDIRSENNLKYIWLVSLEKFTFLKQLPGGVELEEDRLARRFLSEIAGVHVQPEFLFVKFYFLIESSKMKRCMYRNTNLTTNSI